MTKYCGNCGTPLNDDERFCPNCGRPVSQPSPNRPVYYPQGPTPEKKRIGLKIFLIVAFVAVVGYGVMEYLQDQQGKCGGKDVAQTTPSKTTSSKKAKGKVPVHSGEGFSAQVKTDAHNGGVTLGAMKTANMEMFVENGTFAEGAVVEAQPASQEIIDMIQKSGKFESVASPVSINCDQYDGSFFGTDVMLTMPMPGEVGESVDLGKYVFVCYDENTKQMRHLWPRSFDKKNHTMTVRMPHFSWWWSSTMTPEEEVDKFLDEWSMQQAVAQGQQKQAASELAPYVEAKVKALGLTKEAAKDLVQSAINIMVARAGSSYQANTNYKTGEIIDYDVQEHFGYTNITKLVTGVTRAAWDEDEEAGESAIKDFATASVMEAWGRLNFSSRASEVFKSEYVQEFVPGAINQPMLNSGGIASMAGRFAGGDTKGAMMELGKIMQNIDPSVELGTKATVFVARVANTAYTYWMDNEVEELYQIYNHGVEQGLFGNEVIPGNRESFLTFLNTSSGFTKAKGVGRFYDMDKVAETCEKYGWERSDYEHLSPHLKELFEKRAEDGLMEYFELRRRQEAEAKKIKERERVCIQEMMSPTYGVLFSGNYTTYFGEKEWSDFSLTKRMDRLMRLRSTLTKYVDEDRLYSSIYKDSYNWGSLLNEYVSLASQYPGKIAHEKFCEYLESIELLKNGKGYSRDADAFVGDRIEHQISNWFKSIDDALVKTRFTLDENGNFSATAKGVHEGPQDGAIVAGLKELRATTNSTFTVSGHIDKAKGKGTFKMHSSTIQIDVTTIMNDGEVHKTVLPPEQQKETVLDVSGDIKMTETDRGAYKLVLSGPGTLTLADGKSWSVGDVRIYFSTR